MLSFSELQYDRKLGSRDPDIGSSNESYEGIPAETSRLFPGGIGSGDTIDAAPKSLLTLEFHPLVAIGDGKETLARVVLKLSSVGFCIVSDCCIGVA